MNKKYVIYGAGFVGKLMLDMLGNDIEYFIDNKPSVDKINGISVYRYIDVKERLKKESVVIAVSDEGLAEEIREELAVSKVLDVCNYSDIVNDYVKKQKQILGYDYSPILRLMREKHNVDYLFYVDVWVRKYTNIVKTVNMILEKKHNNLSEF